MIVPDLHVMAFKFLEAGKGSQGIEVIVKDRDVHIERAVKSRFTLRQDLRCSIRAPAKVSIMNISSCVFPQYISTGAFANRLSLRQCRQAPLGAALTESSIARLAQLTHRVE